MTLFRDIPLQEGVKICLTPIRDYKTIAKKLIKTGFVIFGIIMVCAGFYNTMIRVHQNHILIRDEVFVAERYTYPSITFCYKYKYGGKDVVQNYLPSLYDKLKASGMVVSFYFDKWILIDYKDQLFCTTYFLKSTESYRMYNEGY